MAVITVDTGVCVLPVIVSSSAQLICRAVRISTGSFGCSLPLALGGAVVGG